MVTSAYGFEGDDDGEVDTGRWKKLEQKKTTGGQVLYTSNWTYNDNEQKNHIDFSKASLEETPSVGNFTWDYTYDKDNADQLKTAERKQVWTGGSAVLNTYGYTFDGIGNRTDRNYAANSLNQYKKNPDAANADIDYDLRGNMTSDGVFDFTWNSANQLTSAMPRTVVTLEQETTAHEQGNDLPASRKVEFGYDDAGRRIWKKSYVYSSAASAWLAVVESEVGFNSHAGWMVRQRWRSFAKRRIVAGHLWACGDDGGFGA